MRSDVLQVIKERRSIREYKPEQIAEEALQAVLEAGTYAANAGMQPWHFTVIQNPQVLDRLMKAAKTNAQYMGQDHLRALGENEDFNCLYGAPTLVIVSAPEGSVTSEQDCAAATQNMLVAAHAAGLGSCWIFFILLAFYAPDADALKKELGIPEGYRPYTSVALGYADEAPEAAPRKTGNTAYIR